MKENKMGLTFLLTCPDDLTKCLKRKPFFIVVEMYFLSFLVCMPLVLSSTSTY